VNLPGAVSSAFTVKGENVLGKPSNQAEGTIGGLGKLTSSSLCLAE
jgi:hypothetical protein